MMKSRRSRVATSSRQNASTLGVWRRSRPTISSRSPPVAEIGLCGVARRRVAREARGDDQVRARPEELEPGLVADLDAPARQQRDAAAQVGQFGPRREVEVRARGAELVVEVMDARIAVLADVAVPVGDGDAGGRLRVRSSSRSSTCAGGNTLGVVTMGRRRSVRMPVPSRTASSRPMRVLLRSRSACFARFRRRVALGDREPGDRPMKSRSILGGELVEQAPVGRQPLQQVGRGEHLLVKCRAGDGLLGRRRCGWHRSRA